MENRKNLYHNILVPERENLIELGKKSGVLHEKDLQALFFGREMTQEHYAYHLNHIQNLGIRIIPADEGGSIFFPEAEALETCFQDDAPVLEYIRELQKNGISRCLTLEQEADLAGKQDYLSNARDLLTDGNLLRVISIARQYLGQGMHVLDLFSEGNQALMDAVNSWTPETDCPISLYLIYHIRRGMRAALTCVTDRPPLLSQDVLEAIRKIREEAPDPEAIRRRQDSRLPVAGENAILFALKKRVVENPDLVTPRELEVLRLRLGLTDGTVHTLEDVADHFGISQERVRQIENKFLRRIRSRKKERRRNLYEE